MMKKSIYNFLIDYGKGKILYNCKTERIVIIDKNLAAIAESNSVDAIEKMHPDFYNYLVENSFLVDENDETSRLINEWKLRDQSGNHFSSFINPTMDCNLNCWYCYENHLSGSLMNEETFSSVVNLIVSKVSNTALQSLSISFFGGEPLLAIDSVIVPLLTKASDICRKNCVILGVSFITNGTLLVPSNLNKLLAIHIGCPYLFQITLDGNAQYHNKVKFMHNNRGTYGQVLANVKDLLSNGQKVLLRLNMTKENLDSYIDVLSDLKNFTDTEKEMLEIDFQHVWQDSGCSDFSKKQKQIRTLFLQSGFNTKELKHIDKSRCYADQDNHVTINYNGDLYKCTAREFNKWNSEGHITKDGVLVWNNKHALRDSVKYGNETCLTCNIYPLCHGGCSQFKMDKLGESGCIRNFSEEYKNKIVEDRVEFLLETYCKTLKK